MRTLRPYQKPIVALLTIILFSLVFNKASKAQTAVDQHIIGPWLWMIAPTTINLLGADSIHVDSLADASAGTVTEICIAENGANVGDSVGNYAWALSAIRRPRAGEGGEIDNVTETLTTIGWAKGNVDYHSSYALITLESNAPQRNVLMRVGSDDAIKVWLNGTVVHTNAINRGSGGFQDEFRVNLRQGDNLLLVKVSEGWGNWTMFVGIDAAVNAVYKPTTFSCASQGVNPQRGKSTLTTNTVAEPVRLSFDTPTTVSAGEQFTAILNIADAVDLAGAQFSLHFDPDILEVTDIHEGDFLSEDGTFFQVEHFNRVPGEISGIRIARARGVDGGGTLLKVDFKAKGSGVSRLEVRDLKLGSSTGVSIASEVVSAEVAVKSHPDVTGDGTVDILDLVLITRHFGPVSATSQAFDINGDGDIDILDLILVTRHLGT